MFNLSKTIWQLNLYDEEGDVAQSWYFLFHFIAERKHKELYKIITTNPEYKGFTIDLGGEPLWILGALKF